MTRRAVEAARAALAFKHDRENLQRWIAYEKRMARWEQRRQGERPTPFKSQLVYPEGHAICEQLGTIFGILSDGAAHFTPEFLSLQDWMVIDDPETPKVSLSYFIRGPESIERGLAGLTAEHLLCLAAFDECYDGAFSADPSWSATRMRLQEAGKRLAPAPRDETTEEQ